MDNSKCPHLRTRIDSDLAVVCLDCGVRIVRPYDPVLKPRRVENYVWTEDDEVY